MYHHGGEIYDRKIAYDFSVNTNPFGMPDSVRAFLQSGEALACACRYPENGNGKLAEAIARKEHVKPGQIVCGNGASELIYAVFRSFGKGRVFLCAPCFSEYEQAADVCGWSTAYYVAKEEHNFQIQQDILGRLKQEKPDLIILCNPSNPVGNCISQPLLGEIAQFAWKQNIRLLADECFLSFLQDEGKRTVKQYMAQEGGTDTDFMVLKAFTKVYGLAGLRLGYLVASDEETAQMIRRQLPDWNVSSLAQQAGILALAEGNYLSHTKMFVKEERKRMERKLGELGFRVYPGEADFLFWRGQRGLKEKLLCDNILIRECNNYTGLSCGGESAYYRTAIRKRQENDILLEALRKTG